MKTQTVFALDASREGAPPAVNRRVHGIPTPLTRQHGREHEVATVIARLREPGVRLLTLTGPGGIGKTRIAIAVATCLAEENTIVVFVPLADVRDPANVGAAIAAGFPIERVNALPSLADVAATIGDQETILVLDNLEHLVPAGTLLVELLAACPALTILTTSRVPLRVSGEWLLPVPPLPTADPSAVVSILTENPSIRLFAERASAVNPSFQLTAENAPIVAAICQRLDGLPLAIELAAGRGRYLSPNAILARLDDRLTALADGPRDAPLRLRSIHDAIAWSLDLLSESEQTLFARLSVFVGGFIAEAADGVATSAQTLHHLTTLVDHGLVLPVTNGFGEPRFSMLETIREFAAELRTASGEDAEIRDAHAAYFLAFGTLAESGLTPPDLPTWLQRVDADIANIRAALDWLRSRGRIADAIRLATELSRYWTEPPHVAEGRVRFDTLLPLVGDDVEPSVLARAILTAANIAILQRDYTAAQPLAERALAHCREIGTDRLICKALGTIGYLAMDQGRLDDAFVLLTEARALAVASGRFWDAAEAANNLARVATVRGQFGEAIALHARSLAEWRQIGDIDNATSAIGSLAWLYRVTGDHGRARDAYETVLDDAVQRRQSYPTAAFLTGFAALAHEGGHHERAVRLFAAADAQFRTLGTPLPRNYQRANDELIAGARRHLGEEAFSAAWLEGQHLPLDEAVAEARALPRAADPLPLGLSPRELAVLRLLAEGHGDAAIAARLYITRKTASNHVAAIIDKLGVPNRTAAAILAVRRGLV